MQKNEKGFTLIELGIVVAVISVLAAVVMAGSGFVSTGKLGKAVEGVNTLKKASMAFAGRMGGEFPSDPAGLSVLETRGLITELNDGVWEMAPGYNVTDLALSHANGTNEIVMTVTFPDLASGQDLHTNLSDGPGYTTEGDCAPPSGGDTYTNICYTGLI